MMGAKFIKFLSVRFRYCYFRHYRRPYLLMPPRPYLLVAVLLCTAILVLPSLYYLSPPEYAPYSSYAPPPPPAPPAHHDGFPIPHYEVMKGSTIMPKLGNQTVKAELGRATWKLLHTMAHRYPEKPKEEEQVAFSSFLYLFSRLYPCGECAAEFQKLLADYPPQTKSQKTASLWLCSIHNRVNERLGKDQFDCSKLDGLYDCGCGDSDDEGNKGETSLVEDLPLNDQALVKQLDQIDQAEDEDLQIEDVPVEHG